jgi:hypothetical protein
LANRFARLEHDLAEQAAAAAKLLGRGKILNHAAEPSVGTRGTRKRRSVFFFKTKSLTP